MRGSRVGKVVVGRVVLGTLAGLGALGLMTCRDVALDGVAWACARDAECGPGAVCRAERCVPTRDAAAVPACVLPLGAGAVRVDVAPGATGAPVLVLTAPGAAVPTQIALPSNVAWPETNVVTGCCESACCTAP